HLLAVLSASVCVQNSQAQCNPFSCRPCCRIRTAISFLTFAVLRKMRGSCETRFQRAWRIGHVGNVPHTGCGWAALGTVNRQNRHTHIYLAQSVFLTAPY